jgi:6-phosphogluconolactonase
VHASYAVGIGPEGIAIDPTGTFLYVSNAHDGTVSAFKISTVDGSLSVIGTYTTAATAVPSASPTALAVDPSGQFLYVANGDDGSITAFTITAGTGVLAAVAGGGRLRRPMAAVKARVR